MECDATVNATDGSADCGVFGGWPWLVFDYAIAAGGLRTEEDMPYCVHLSEAGQCYPCMASGYSKAYCGDHDDLSCDPSTTRGQGAADLCDSTTGFAVSVSSWAAFSENETEIAAALVATGPLSVSLNAEYLQHYRKGIFSPSRCDPDELDHAVLLVGYGSDGGQDYWTVKNSWGESWGEDGYFRILRGEGTCGINTRATSAVL